MNNLKFLEYNYPLNNIITPIDIYLFINKFYLYILNKKNRNEKVSIIFKVKTINNNWLNVSPLLIEDELTIDKLIQIFLFYWGSQPNKNKILKLEKIVILYKFIPLDIESVSSVFKCSKYLKIIQTLPEDYINLPNNRLLETWGDDIIINNNDTYLININNNSSYYIIKLNNEYFVWLKDSNTDIQYFQDIYDPYSQSNNTFIRNIGTSTLYYKNGIHYIL